MPIPTDWNEEEQGYALYIVCGPNSDMWRRNVKGALYALTRGRNYDFDTGIFKDIEQIANRMDDTFMACQLDELVDELKNITRTQRMLVASIVGEAINFDQQPELPNAINYEGLYSILKAQNAILDDGMTLQELKDIIDGIDLTNSGFLDTLTDIAQILTFLILLWGPTQNVNVAFSWWDKFAWKRYQHNSLTIAAHQATSLRGIMRGITPFKEESEEDEKTLWETLSSVPWLARAVVAIAEPSPAGEAALIATTIGGAINTVYQTIRTAWNIWWNKWINLIETPEPIDSITAALGVIANRISTRADTAENPDVSVTNRLDVIAQALAGLDTAALVPALALISTTIEGIGTLPPETNWEELFDGLNQQIEESMAVNVNVTCGSCGSSGGCGCGSGSNGANGPGVSGPNDSPPGSTSGSGIQPGFPDSPSYDVYKCKAANVLALNIAEMFAQYAEFEGTDFSQYTVFAVAKKWIADKISLAGSNWGGILTEGSGWVSEKIMAVVWPYPSPLAVTLSAFSEARLLWLNDREDNVCGIYTSNNVDQVRSFIEEAMDGYIDQTSVDAGSKIRAKEIYKGLLTNRFLNRLFEKDTMVSNYTDVSSVDCSNCESGDYTIVIGNPQSGEGANPFTVELVYSTFSGMCGPALKRGILVNFSVPVTIHSITGIDGEANCSGVEKYFLYPTEGAGGNWMYSENVPPEDVSGVRSLACITGGGGSPEATISFSED